MSSPLLVDKSAPVSSNGSGEEVEEVQEEERDEGAGRVELERLYVEVKRNVEDPETFVTLGMAFM